MFIFIVASRSISYSGQERVLMVFGFTNIDIINTFCQASRSRGLRAAAKEVLTMLGIHLELDGTIPKKGGVLVVSNHMTVVDIFKLLATIDRDDVFMISFSLNRVLGTEFEQRLLPIYLSQKRTKNPLIQIRLSYWTKKEGSLSREEALMRNRKTIHDAASLVSHGKCVVMFPSGFSMIHKGVWQNGVGYLIAQVANPDAVVVGVHLSGSSMFELMQYRFYHIVRHFAHEIHARITVVGQWQISRFAGLDDGKAITRRLHNLYFSQV